MIPISPLPQFYAQAHLAGYVCETHTPLLCAQDYIFPLNDRPQFIFPFSI